MIQFPRITIDPHVMGGKPCLRGLRVTVGTIVGQMAAGRSQQAILEDYPYLEPEDLLAALAYAACAPRNRKSRWTSRENSGRHERVADMVPNLCAVRLENHSLVDGWRPTRHRRYRAFLGARAGLRLANS